MTYLLTKKVNKKSAFESYTQKDVVTFVDFCF